jgi:uncharacterized membrane protein
LTSSRRSSTTRSRGAEHVRSPQPASPARAVPSEAGGRGNRLLPGIAALAVAGIAISGYLTYTHLANATVICTGLHSCDYVQQSEYATIAGIPIAFFGLLLYVAILAGAVVALRSLRLASTAGLVIFGCALAGLLYAAYLTYLELFVLHAICIWCVASAITTTAIFILSLLRELVPGAPGSAR